MNFGGRNRKIKIDAAVKRDPMGKAIVGCVLFRSAEKGPNSAVVSDAGGKQ